MIYDQLTLHDTTRTVLSIPKFTPSSLNVLQSVDGKNSSHTFNDQVSNILGITRTPIRMESQAKYGSLARGEGGIYLRAQTNSKYQEKIWVRGVLSLPHY